jgi:malate:Na+ symporter
MFVPLIVGTTATISAGLLVGILFGYTIHRTFFYIIIPIIGGGIGEGILPLSIGYSTILKIPQEALIGQLIPAAVIGNIVAIVCAGLLKRLGEKKPELTGNGVLVKTGEDLELLNAKGNNKPVASK